MRKFAIFAATALFAVASAAPLAGDPAIAQEVVVSAPPASIWDEVLGAVWAAGRADHADDHCR
jgi:hypothetical protein